MHIHRDMFGYASSLTAQPSTQTAGVMQLAARGDRDGDADGSSTAGASGTSSVSAFLEALGQALESLGKSLDPAAAASSSASGAAGTAAATSASTAPSSASTATSPAGTGSASTAASAAGTGASTTATSASPREVHRIVRDIRHVLGALFSDIQAENVLAPASSGSSSSFGSGLAALISQVQSGSVPANLQNAFGKLVSDLEKFSGSSSSSGAPVTGAPVTPRDPSVTAATSSSAPAATVASAVAPSASATASPQSTTAATAGGVGFQGLLLQFLTNLQSDLGLGYGASSSAPAQGATSGLMVNTLA